MLPLGKNGFHETSYSVKDEAKNATLFGIGNGYFGIRGSFEEFGDVGVQGTYVRGLFTSLIEDPHAHSENLYMKRYYFDEEKLKEFEYEDCCVNVSDFTAIRLFSDGEELRPWTAKIISWERHFTFSDGGLVRRVVYEDKKGNRTRFTFKKWASFADDHLILQELSVEKLGHDAPIEVRLGVDTLVKTEGQKVSKASSSQTLGQGWRIHYGFGEKYGFLGECSASCSSSDAAWAGNDEKDGFFFSSYRLKGRKAAFHKMVSFYASLDPDWEKKEATMPPFDEALSAHRHAYRAVWSMVDMQMDDPDNDAMLRYANYQTLIGANRHDSVHSLSAKNLTSERYNQFVWWDCEIFQRPYFDNLLPEVSKATLCYRYDRLPAAKEIAASLGYQGAKYAFCSSVRGDENVWPYARHAGMQIHISADVAYGFLAYARATGDEAFLKEKGIPVIEEVMRYFLSRASLDEEGHYHLRSVTGTDEHHDYIDDDAYTNAIVRFVGTEFLRKAQELSFPIDPSFASSLKDFLSRLVLPSPDRRGILPQFDGYFQLAPNLPEQEGRSPGFQMAHSGLYHLSQIIKQPDVLMLFSYLDIGMEDHYRENYLFYRRRCEASSSLTYPVHGLCAIDLGRKDDFYEDWRSCCLMDFEDYYHGAAQGLHAGALAGARILLTRGLAGFHNEEECLKVAPHWHKAFAGLRFHYVYHRVDLECSFTRRGLLLKSSGAIDLQASAPIHLEKGEECLIPYVSSKHKQG